MAKGKVKWFSKAKGYGFISVDDSTRDVFVHSTAMKDTGDSFLSEGQAVEFEITKGPKGEQAANVVCL